MVTIVFRYPPALCDMILFSFTSTQLRQKQKRHKNANARI